jgi:hypothetical protein
MIEDRRISERISARLKVMHGVSGANFLGYTLNISPNGLAIQSPLIFPSHRRICIDLYIGDEVTKLDGIVVWSSWDIQALNSKMGIRLSQDLYKFINSNFIIVPVGKDILILE